MLPQVSTLRRADTCPMLAAVVCLALMMPCAGCTPLVLDADRAAIGCFRNERHTLAPGITYDQLEGIGIGVIDGSFVIGYRRQESVYVDLGSAPIRVETPFAEVATGACAEEWAATFVSDQLGVRRSNGGSR